MRAKLYSLFMAPLAANFAKKAPGRTPLTCQSLLTNLEFSVGSTNFPTPYPIPLRNRSRGTVPIFAAEEVLVVGNRLSPRKWDCPLRPVRGQVHVFGFRLSRQ